MYCSLPNDELRSDTASTTDDSGVGSSASSIAERRREKRSIYQMDIMHISPATAFKFKFEDEQNDSVDYLTIFNVTDRHLAYHVTATNPDSYYVKPGKGIVLPHESITVAVNLRAGAAGVERDTFAVMGLLVDSNTRVSDMANLFARPDQCRLHKLRCDVVRKSELSQVLAMLDVMQARLDGLDTMQAQLDRVRVNQQQMEAKLQRFQSFAMFIVVVVVVFVFLKAIGLL